LDIVQKTAPLSENSSPLLLTQAGYGPAFFWNILFLFIRRATVGGFAKNTSFRDLLRFGTIIAGALFFIWTTNCNSHVAYDVPGRISQQLSETQDRLGGKATTEDAYRKQWRWTKRPCTRHQPSIRQNLSPRTTWAITQQFQGRTSYIMWLSTKSSTFS